MHCDAWMKFSALGRLCQELVLKPLMSWLLCIQQWKPRFWLLFCKCTLRYLCTILHRTMHCDVLSLLKIIVIKKKTMWLETWTVLELKLSRACSTLTTKDQSWGQNDFWKRHVYLRNPLRNGHVYLIRADSFFKCVYILHACQPLRDRENYTKAEIEGNARIVTHTHIHTQFMFDNQTLWSRAECTYPVITA